MRSICFEASESGICRVEHAKLVGIVTDRDVKRATHRCSRCGARRVRPVLDATAVSQFMTATH